MNKKSHQHYIDGCIHVFFVCSLTSLFFFTFECVVMGRHPFRQVLLCEFFLGVEARFKKDQKHPKHSPRIMQSSSNRVKILQGLSQSDTTRSHYACYPKDAPRRASRCQCPLLMQTPVANCQRCLLGSSLHQSGGRTRWSKKSASCDLPCSPGQVRALRAKLAKAKAQAQPLQIACMSLR